MKSSWISFSTLTRSVSPFKRKISSRSVVVWYQWKEMTRVTHYRFTSPLFLTRGTVRLEVDVVIDSNIFKFVDSIRILCSQFLTHIDWKDVSLTCPKLAFCNVIGKSSHSVNSVELLFLTGTWLFSCFRKRWVFCKHVSIMNSSVLKSLVWLVKVSIPTLIFVKADCVFQLGMSIASG